jgi:hypothetical protein
VLDLIALLRKIQADAESCLGYFCFGMSDGSPELRLDSAHLAQGHLGYEDSWVLDFPSSGDKASIVPLDLRPLSDKSKS